MPGLTRVPSSPRCLSVSWRFIVGWFHFALVAIPLLAESNPMTPAINQLGLDLLRARVSAGDRRNLLLSLLSRLTGGE